MEGTAAARPGKRIAQSQKNIQLLNDSRTQSQDQVVKVDDNDYSNGEMPINVNF